MVAWIQPALGDDFLLASDVARRAGRPSVSNHLSRRPRQAQIQRLTRIGAELPWHIFTGQQLRRHATLSLPLGLAEEIASVNRLSK